MQLAPDGKIYSSAPNGVLSHVIHDPDGSADFSTNNTASNSPKYNGFRFRNFPTTASAPRRFPCDTLGLNNDPRAWWRHQQDALDPLAVVFHDLSTTNPPWQWDFGDGSPVLEKACATRIIPTPLRADTSLPDGEQRLRHAHHCKTLYLGVSPTDNPVLQAQVVLSPNPSPTASPAALSTPSLRSPVLRLYDVAGRLVLTGVWSTASTKINTSVWKRLYFWAVEAGVRVGVLIFKCPHAARNR